jgi:hypothetical protein
MYSVCDPEFVSYGKVLNGYDASEVIGAMNAIPLPENDVAYEPSILALETCDISTTLQNNAYGGMPVQLGLCWGRNTKLNCLEYHRDSEFILGAEDFILLLAKQDEIRGGKLDTACVKAFRAPEGVLVEVYATTLHYAPCHSDRSRGFRVLVVLPKGTNTGKPEIKVLNEEDDLLWGCNKWLLAHPESDEALQGAHTGLVGENIDIANEIQAR